MTHAPVRTLQVIIGIKATIREPELHEKVIGLYKLGESQNEIGRQHHISQPEVSKILRPVMKLIRDEHEKARLQDLEFKDKIRQLMEQLRREKKLTNIYDYRDVVNQYRNLFFEGRSVEDLHKITGAPVRTLQRIIRPASRKRKAMVAKKVVLYYRKGLTQAEIGRHVGKSQGTVHNIIVELIKELSEINYQNYKTALDDIVHRYLYKASVLKFFFKKKFDKNNKNDVRIKELLLIYKYKGKPENITRYIKNWRTITNALSQIITIGRCRLLLVAARQPRHFPAD